MTRLQLTVCEKKITGGGGMDWASFIVLCKHGTTWDIYKPMCSGGTQPRDHRILVAERSMDLLFSVCVCVCVCAHTSHLLLHSWIINGADIPGMAVSSLFDKGGGNQWTASRWWGTLGGGVGKKGLKDKVCLSVSGISVCVCVFVRHREGQPPVVWLRGTPWQLRFRRHALNIVPGDRDLPPPVPSLPVAGLNRKFNSPLFTAPPHKRPWQQIFLQTRPRCQPRI